jgi:hypothetical protein
VLVGAPADPAVARMRQELVVLGFEVDEVPLEASSLAALARERHAVAVARIEPTPRSIALWFEPSAGGPAASPSELHLDAASEGSSDAALLALRAVELLRGRLLPVASSAAPASSSAPPPAAPASATPPVSSVPPGPVAPPVEPARAVWSRDASGHAAPVLLVAPGGLPPAVGVLVGGRGRVAERIEIDASLIVPTAGASVSDAHGSARLRFASIGVGAAVELTPPRGRVYATAGLGASLALLVYSGEAGAPYVGSSGARAAVVPHARVAAGLGLTPRVGLRLDVLAALVRPEPALRIAGAEVASLGAPLAGLALGLEVRP